MNDNNLRLYFRFIRYALGLCPWDGADIDWRGFYRFCKAQTLLGVAFDGVQRLPREQAPQQQILLSWFAAHRQIAMRNRRMNEATAEIYNRVRTAGAGCCILKGQANAMMYPNPSSRIPGDVDAWVDAPREQIRRIAHSLALADGRVGEECLYHISLTVGDVDVELHFTPAVVCNPIYNRRVQKWMRRNAKVQCDNVVALPDGAGDVAVPTAEFNAVYQLLHLYHHYLYEGVGLRQIVDYYFVVSALHADGAAMQSLRRELRRLGLWHFAGAVMYVLHEVMGLEPHRMVAPVDRRRGLLLMAEILAGGNFGHHGENHGGARTWRHNIYRLKKDLRLVAYYPAECLAEPFYRLWHFVWRWRVNAADKTF